MPTAVGTGTTEHEMNWAPTECTLPTAERPLRVAEFDELFATSLRAVARVTPTHLRLILDGGGPVEATTRDLVARETACCSFFAFDLDRTGDDRLQVDVQVPAPYSQVLDGLAARAAAATSAAGAA
jgi:hypothetical protein